MYERVQLQSLTKRIKEPRKHIQALVGPRQVGKTTLVTQLTKKIILRYLFESADAIASANTVWIEQIWETARLRMQQSNAKEFYSLLTKSKK